MPLGMAPVSIDTALPSLIPDDSITCPDMLETVTLSFCPGPETWMFSLLPCSTTVGLILMREGARDMDLTSVDTGSITYMPSYVFQR